MYMAVTTELQVFRSSYRKLARVDLERKTTKSFSYALTY